MSVYTTMEDIYNEDGILLLRKGQRVNKALLRKLKKFGSFVSIDSSGVLKQKVSDSFDSSQRVSKVSNSSEGVSDSQIVQAFGARKFIRDEHIVEKPGEILSNIIFESKSKPWWIHINALANHVDWLYTHSVDTAMISLIMAVELGYGDEQLYHIGLGALMHDIGKLLVPKSIIDKPEPLTDTEKLLLRQHCELGMSSLESYNLPRECTDIILQHHERLDGSGYPKGLKEDEICLNARIVMIADAVDAITSGRPYRKATYNLDDAIKIIKKEGKYSHELISFLDKILQ